MMRALWVSNPAWEVLGVGRWVEKEGIREAVSLEMSLEEQKYIS